LMDEKKLTPKQARFVEEYLIDLNATQAAIRAGYSEHTARQIGMENLTKPYISDFLAEQLSKRSEQTGITARWVLEQAADVYKEAREEQDRSNALKALEQVGKHVDVQAFKDKQEIDHKGDINFNTYYEPKPEE